MTDDELLTLGDFCAGLELHSQFQALAALFEQQQYADFMNTQSHETKKREGIYAEHAGYQNFRTFMKLWVDAAVKIREANDAPALSEYDAQPQDID